jgi:hypothetical protein
VTSDYIRDVQCPVWLSPYLLASGSNKIVHGSVMVGPNAAEKVTLIDLSCTVRATGAVVRPNAKSGGAPKSIGAIGKH